MATYLPGRSDNHIKNRWNCALKKKNKDEYWYNSMLTRDLLLPALGKLQSKVANNDKLM